MSIELSLNYYYLKWMNRRNVAIQIKKAWTTVKIKVSFSLNVARFSLSMSKIFLSVYRASSILTHYHPSFPSTMCWATSSGNFTPRISSSVKDFMASTQASNGDKQTYHPAQKNPTGHARNHRQRNQMIAHNTFIVLYKPRAGENINI